jgi:large subunit ribosomal protein L10
VTGEKDVAPVAKILKTFAAEFKIAALKIGLVDKSLLSTQEVEMLADLPSREVLLGQLLGLFLAPATKLVRLLNEPASAFARLLNAKAKAMPAEPEQPAPAAEAPAAAENAAAEAPAENAAAEAPPAENTPAAETKAEEKPTTEGAA